MKKRKYSSYKSVFYRRIKTTQELRANQDCELTRAKRKNIPNAYDDIVVKSRTYKSWKKIRRNQYREDNSSYSWHQIERHRFNYGYSNYEQILKECYRLGYYTDHFYDTKTKNYYLRWYGKDIS